jgi:hypothetical protein
MNQLPKHCNANTYALASSASSASITFVDSDLNVTDGLIYNNSQYAAFAQIGATAAPTVVAPTSATVPSTLTVIPPGGVVVFSKAATDKFLGIISLAADTGKYIYVQMGQGS